VAVFFLWRASTELGIYGYGERSRSAGVCNACQNQRHSAQTTTIKIMIVAA
jgi:hypothetical protein